MADSGRGPGPSRAAPLDAPTRPIAGNGGQRVQQPTPQALPSRNQTSAILVNMRQKGNPVIQNIRGVPWEYAETPADYVLGATTCALFLSLKYHRLHPEYIYSRIGDIKGKFKLRILLTMVDITNHEESLKELSKTSLINNVTLILCWSAQEAGRYLELFKSYENAAPTSIKAHQSDSYSDRLVEFITVPRSVNKTDAVSLVSAFGSLRTAVNAEPAEVTLVNGWGGKKVTRWCSSVREPFRARQSERRGVSRDDSRATLSRDISRADPADAGAFAPPLVKQSSSVAEVVRPTAPSHVHRLGSVTEASVDVGGEDANMTGNDSLPETTARGAEAVPREAPKGPQLSEGVAAALARLRNQ